MRNLNQPLARTARAFRRPACVVVAVGVAFGSAAAAQESPRTHLHLLPTPTVLAKGSMFGTVGQVTPLAGAADGADLGSGNQTYHALVAAGLGGGWMGFAFVQNNDDPSWGLVAGARRGRELTGIGGGLRRSLPGRERRAGSGEAGAGLRASAELTLGYFSVKSDPGLFNAEAVETRRSHVAASLAGMIGIPLAGGWSATVAPALIRLPEENSGAPFYGWTGLLGLGVDGPVARGLRAFATWEVPTGPGTNWVDRDFAFRRIPTWSLGAIWDRTPRVGTTVFVTNSAGGSPHTRHLTHLGEAPVQWGLRLRWAPVEPDPGEHAAPLPGDADGGIGVPAAPALPPGTVSLRGSVDARDGNGLRLRVSASRALEFVVGVSRSPDLDARPELGIDLGGTTHYRMGAKLNLIDQGAGRNDAAGSPLTVAARLTVGRESGTQTGYLQAELPAHRRFGERFALTATLAVVQSGGDTPVALGFSGVFGRAEGFRAVVEPTLLLTGQPSLWTAGLRFPRMGPLRAELYTSTARGIQGLSRFLGDPDRPLLGVTMEARFRPFD